MSFFIFAGILCSAMKSCLSIFILFLLISAGNSYARETFLLKKASKNFDLKIKIDGCEEDTCEGVATVYLMKKGQSTPWQTIKMSNMFLELGENKKPTANLIELYGENNSGIVFDDFNFDGVEDLALRNGNNGSYGGPSYDIFLFTRKANKFVESADLSSLASENLGLFTVDKKAKTIETFNKSGCCWHETTRYKMVNNRPVKVYVFTEDAMSSEKVTITTRTRVNGKWKKKVRTALIKDYYKDQ